MSANRWMDQEDINTDVDIYTYIHNEILLGHKKWKFSICDSVDG